MSAPSGKPRKKGLAYWLPTTLSLVIGLAVWPITWVLPLTFMVAMDSAGALSGARSPSLKGEHDIAIDIAAKRPPAPRWPSGVAFPLRDAPTLRSRRSPADDGRLHLVSRALDHCRRPVPFLVSRPNRAVQSHPFLADVGWGLGVVGLLFLAAMAASSGKA